MLIVPVRHHSPAAAAQARRIILERRPRAVLVEGPADATELIPLLLDGATVPPVALYAYFADEPSRDSGKKNGAPQPERREERRVRAVYYPFCEYSPELAALRAGQEVGARLQFCDVSAAEALLHDDARREEADAGEAGNADEESEVPAADGRATQPRPGKQDDAASPAPPALPGYGEFADAVTQASGYDSFEEFWEAAFEQEASAGGPEAFVELLATFGAQARSFDAGAWDAYNAHRERCMAAAARRLVDEGIAADEIVLVCGAAHAEAIRTFFGEGQPDSSEAPEAQQGPSAQIALIPFSYPRLSEQLGYGAGNRAPWYYQQVWRQQGDYGEATRRGLIAVARHLRARGLPASLAQCIDGYTLAMTLAGMRRKRAPGVDELRDAAVACFASGQEATVRTALSEMLIGNALGKVTPRVGRTPLQSEFYAATAELGLPVLDQPKQVLVHLVSPREAAQSTLLHRLSVAGIPYATELESGLGARRSSAATPVQQLARVREKWQLQWTPATDAQLVERTAWGSTLREVCGRLLDERLAAAGRIDAGTQVLLQMALCDLTERLPDATARCEALAADSASFPALARATYHLDGLLSYGAARKLPAERLGALAARLFLRAAVHLPGAVSCGDDAALEIQEALTSLSDLVSRRSAAIGETAPFWTAVETVAELPGTHPHLRGLALVLLELDGRLDRHALAGRLRFWLSRGREAQDNARLVAGLFSLHRSTLVRNQALIGAVTDFLAGLEVPRLIPLLPVLRRSLGQLSAAERSYLTETLARLLGLSARETGWTMRLSSTDLAVLREADAAVAATLAGWKERYGIG